MCIEHERPSDLKTPAGRHVLSILSRYESRPTSSIDLVFSTIA